MNDNISKNLTEAIATMRNFLDEAERNINRDDMDDEDKLARTIHAFGWGQANAMSNIETAAMWLREARLQAEHEAAK